MRRTALLLAFTLAVPLAAVAQTPNDESRGPADKTQAGDTQTSSTPTTEQTRTQTEDPRKRLGEHVRSVAPEHPLAQGVLFGECVAELALTGECPHGHEE